MKKYDKTLPFLEINPAKKILVKERNRNLNKLDDLLKSNLYYKINQKRAYSYFNSIKEKKLKTKEAVTKIIPKINTKEECKNKLYSINNKLSKTIEVKKIRKSIFEKKISDKDKRKGSYICRPFYYEPLPENIFRESLISMYNSDFKSVCNNTLKNRDEFIAQKEKENLYKKNIENKYNIKINRFKLYSRNKKLFLMGIKKNPNYFKKNYESYFKSLSMHSSFTLENFNKTSNFTISAIRNNNKLNIKKITNDNFIKDKNKIKNIKRYNNIYKYIKIKKQTINVDEISKS